MFNTGLYALRDNPMWRCYRGWDPLNPRLHSSVWPVRDGLSSVIKGGMIVFPVYNSSEARTEWDLQPPAHDVLPHIAAYDGDAEDVVAADGLVGLPCTGQFEVHTPFFLVDGTNSEEEYAQNVPLTYACTDRTSTSTRGRVKLCTGTSDVLVGVLTAPAPFSVVDVDRSFTVDTTTDVNNKVVKFRTATTAVARDANG